MAKSASAKLTALASGLVASCEDTQPTLHPKRSATAHHPIFLARMRHQDSSACQGVAKPTACASTPSGSGSSRKDTQASRWEWRGT